MDKTFLNLISIVLGGAGLLVVLTKFNVPELNVTFLGTNPYVIKRDVIESVMTWIFTVLTLLGLLVQAVVAIWSDQIEERTHPTWLYIVVFLGVLAAVVALVSLLTAVGNSVARRFWLPKILENQKDGYRAARYIVEHDGWREDQLAARATLADPERYRAANLDSAARSVEQIEKLLEVSPALDDLRARLDRLRSFFERENR